MNGRGRGGRRHGRGGRGRDGRGGRAIGAQKYNDDDIEALLDYADHVLPIGADESGVLFDISSRDLQSTVQGVLSPIFSHNNTGLLSFLLLIFGGIHCYSITARIIKSKMISSTNFAPSSSICMSFILFRCLEV